jgi:uncharacterized FlaG/YvyC family protein
MVIDSNIVAAVSTGDPIVAGPVDEKREVSSKPPAPVSNDEIAISTPSPYATQKADSPKISKEEAKQIAAEIEQALNKQKDTIIKFDVSLVEEEKQGSNEFRFKIVERKTGRIVRQFPPEDIFGLKERVTKNPAPTSGVIIDQVA